MLDKNATKRVARGRNRFRPVGDTLTKQSMAEDCDINRIVAKYVADESLAVWNARPGRYGDFTGPQELQDALQRVIEAQESFEALPANIRAHVDNDPVEFLSLVHDPSRREELKALGLLPPGEAAPQPGSSLQGPEGDPALKSETSGE